MKLLPFLLPFLAAAQTGSIEGVAIDKMTKAPVAKVLLKMTADQEPGRYYYATTDASGAYRFDKLPAGPYSPWIDPPEGYFPPDPMQMMLKRTLVTVKDGETAKFDVELTPPSILRGRVFAPDGKPAPGVTVLAVSLGKGGHVAQADPEGRFVLQLRSGRYRIHARAGLTTAWAQTYYPNVTDESVAELIDLPEAADLGGYDIRLQPKGKAAVRGVVRDDAGKPVAGVEVTLGTVAKATSDAEGAFELKPVPAGRWNVLATSRREGVRWEAQVPVTVTDRDVERMDLRIAPPFAYDVVVEGAPKDARPVMIYLQRTVGFTDSPSMRTDKDGRARFDRVYAGEHRVGVFGFLRDYYLKAILLGEAEVTGRPIELGPASPPLKIVYAPNAGRISGEVKDGAGAKVALVRADRDAYIPGTDAVTLLCDEHGKFGASGVRPGNWYLVAYRGDEDNVRDRIFDRGLWREAASVKVAEGETATVKLSVTRGNCKTELSG